MAKLKGHAVIELTDVNTGKKEVVEHDNLITNAPAMLCDWFSKVMGYSVFNSKLLPAEERLFRGIYLFDEALTENANNINLPDVASAKLTGYAGAVASDGNDNKRGDFNSAESEALLNGYKFVWDFGTDDANGTIASLALTNPVAGYLGYNYDFYSAITSPEANTGNTYNNYKGLGMTPFSYANDYEYAYVVEYSNGVITTIHKTSATNIKITKHKCELSKVTLKNHFVTLDLIEETNITISDSVQTQTNDVFFVDGGDGYYYGIYGVNSGSNYQIKISKIDKTTLAYTAAQSYTLNNINAPEIVTASTSTRSNKMQCAIRNGYLYAYYGTWSSNGYATMGLFKTPLSNPANYTKLVGSEKTLYYANYGDCFYMLLLNGNIYTGGFVVGSDDTLVEIDNQKVQQGRNLGSYGDYNRIVTDGLVVVGLLTSTSYYYYYLPLLQLLESINNLDTPVLKTASKTMKITYTLTEAS